MVCPQSIVLGCAAAGLAGRERAVMVKALGYFAVVLFVACLSVVVGFMAMAARPAEPLTRRGNCWYNAGETGEKVVASGGKPFAMNTKMGFIR